MNFEIHRFFFTGKLTRQQNKNAQNELICIYRCTNAGVISIKKLLLDETLCDAHRFPISVFNLKKV